MIPITMKIITTLHPKIPQRSARRNYRLLAGPTRRPASRLFLSLLPSNAISRTTLTSTSSEGAVIYLDVVCERGDYIREGYSVAVLYASLLRKVKIMITREFDGDWAEGGGGWSRWFGGSFYGGSCVRTGLHEHACKHMHMQTESHRHRNIYVCICVCVCICICKSIYVCTYAFMYLEWQTLTCTQGPATLFKTLYTFQIN